MDVYPYNPRLRLAHANQTYGNSSPQTLFPNLWNAYLCLRDKKGDNADYCDVYRDLAELFGHAEVIDRWHFKMLNDRRRNMAYKIALQQVMKQTSFMRFAKVLRISLCLIWVYQPMAQCSACARLKFSPGTVTFQNIGIIDKN